MGHVLLLALAAALNPTLVAASTMMMLLPSPVKLMLGYLLGALMTSITLGLVIVFSLENSDAVSTVEQTLSPAATLTLGALFLIAAFVIGTGRYQRAAERRHTRHDRREEKGPPRWQKALGRGSARITFVVGALLTLPGASYLAGLSRIDKLNYHGSGRRRLQPDYAGAARDTPSVLRHRSCLDAPGDRPGESIGRQACAAVRRAHTHSPGGVARNQGNDRVAHLIV
jgi:Sap, sulfolipid-1-addressing protein